MSHENKMSDIAKIKNPTKAIGSVLFFKRIILSFLSLLIFSLLFGCVMLKIQNHQLFAETLQLRSDLEIIQTRLNAEDAENAAIIAASTPTVPTAGASASKESFPYQTMYPELYCKQQVPISSPAKTVFLTFDDGPSENTVKVLDILKKYDVKATFFVVGNASARGVELMKRIVAEGHSIGVHTYTHDYKTIYASIESYLADFKKEYDLISSTTGVTPTIFRFPGGSINSYDRGIYQQLIAEMTRRGFTYYDWSVSSGDGSTATTSASIKSNIVDTIAKVDHGIVLMHDSAANGNTSGVLEEVIVELLHRGYQFAPINNEVMPVTFLYLH